MYDDGFNGFRSSLLMGLVFGVRVFVFFCFFFVGGWE